MTSSRSLFWGLRSASLAVLALTALPETPVRAQGSWSEQWVVSSANDGNWNPTATNTALGYYGTQSMIQAGPFTDFTRLMSTFDTSNATPVWSHTDPFETQYHRVAAAETAPLFATLHSRSTDDPFGLREVVLRTYHPTSSVPEHELVVPVLTNGHGGLFVAISRDGAVVVSAVRDIFASQNGLSNTLITMIDTETGNVSEFRVDVFLESFRYGELSADGRRLLLGNTSEWVVADTVTQQTIHSGSMPFGFQPDGGDLSADGSTVVIHGAQVVASNLHASARVFLANQSGGYTFDQEIRDSFATRCRVVSLSDDGLRLVRGLDNADFSRVSLRGIEFDPITRDFGSTFAHDSVASSVLPLRCSSVEVDPKGETAVFGLSGDAAGPDPEILVFDTDSSSPVESIDLPGSVFSVDLVNGFLLVASKAGHVSEFVTGGEVRMFSRSRDFLVNGGKPRPSSVLDVATTGALPTSFTRVLESPRLGGPWAVGNVGVLWPDRNTLTSTPLGFVDAAGSALGTFTCAPVVGQVRFAQGFHTGPSRRLTGDWIPVMTLP